MFPELTETRVQDLVALASVNVPIMRRVREEITAVSLKHPGVEAWLFGGAVRSMVAGQSPRDWDLIFSGPREGFDDVLAGLAATEDYEVIPDTWGPSGGGDLNKGESRGDWGKLHLGGEVADLWHVSQQRGLRDLPEQFWCAKLVPATTFLTIESVVARVAPNPHQVTIHDDGFFDCMRSGLVKARPEWKSSINRLKFAVKAMSTLARLPDFRLSPYLAAFVARQLNGNDEAKAKLRGLEEERLGAGSRLPVELVSFFRSLRNDPIAMRAEKPGFHADGESLLRAGCTSIVGT